MFISNPVGVPFCSKQTLFYVFFYALNSVGWLISVR
nr:MAG TPA: hypothetical protein [Caudoviricetes sp.]